MMQIKDPTLLRQQAYIDGQWCNADSGETCAVTNPATSETIGTVPKMGAAETRRAIVAADKAWGSWRAKTGKERSAVLRKWNDLMLANADDLAMIMTVEQGKPLAEAKGEIAYAASQGVVGSIPASRTIKIKDLASQGTKSFLLLG